MRTNKSWMVGVVVGLAVPSLWAALPPGANFFTTTPCRVYDSSVAGPPDALEHGVPRLIQIAGICGVPFNSSSVHFNLTVLNATADGDIILYSADAPTPAPPRPGALPFKAGQTKAKNGIVSLSATGAINALATMSAGATVDLIIDVSGYFVDDQGPVAVNDSAAVDEDAAATAIDVLTNDTDVDVGPKAIASASDPANGTVVLTGGSPGAHTGLTYQPDLNYCNATPDTFTYTLTPGGSTATVEVTVDCVNDAPAGTDNTVDTPEDTDYVFTAADFGFTDPNDTPANALLAVKITTLPGDGSLTLSNVAVVAGQDIAVADITGGNLEFSPAAGESGTPYTSFTFQVQDDGGTAVGGVDLDPSANTMTIDVTGVNNEPAGADNTVATNEDIAYTFAAANFGFTDPNDTPADDFFAVKITTLPGAGTLALSAVPVVAGQDIPVAQIANLVFTPAANANGSPYTSFTFQVQDDGGIANSGVDLDPTPNTMTINVNSVNDAPAGTDNTVTTDEDVQYTFTLADFGFTDPNDSPANSFASVIVSAPTAGSLTLTGEVTAAQITGNLLKFTPAANAFGSPYATFTFQVRDNGGVASGGVDLDPSANTMTINVTPVNDAPTVLNESFQAFGNTELRVDMAAGTTPHITETTAGVSSYEGVLDNDGDVEGDVVTVTAVGSGCADPTPPFDCTLTSGAVVHVDANGEFTFTPGPGDTSDSFQYTVTDQPPVGTPISANGTVSFTHFEMVWYVNNSGAAGNGTSISPFNAITGANLSDTDTDGAGGDGFEDDADDASDYIFVYFGAGTDLNQASGLVLEASQHLLGQFAGLSIPVGLNGDVSPTVLVAPPGATDCSGGPCRPLLSNTAGSAVTASDNDGVAAPAIGTIPVEIVGMSLQGTVNAIDLTTNAALSGSSTLTILQNVFRGAGAEGIDVNLDAGTTGTLTLDVLTNSWNLAGTHTGNAVDINRAAGTLNLNFSANTDIVSAAVAGAAVSINGGAAANTTITGFASNSISGNTAGHGVVISNATFDSVAGGGVTQVDGDNLAIGAGGNPVGGAGTGAGMSISGLGSVFFDDLDIFAGASGLTVNGVAFAVTPASPDGSGTSTIDADNGAAVDISNSALDLRLADLDSNTTGSGVNLNTVSGQFRAPSGSAITKASGAGTAFVVATSSATVNYAGTLNVTAGSGVALTSNTGSSTFSGGMTLSTGASTAFSASGGGTVNVIDPAGGNNTITTTTATAVNISGTTIGASHVTFESINSATASANIAIVLANTGAGQFLVTGTGSAGSGGTIDNKTVDAMTMNNTDGLVTLKHMIIEDIGDLGGGFDTFSTDDAIHGEQVDGGLTLENMTIRRISDQAVHGATLGGNTATVWNGLTITNSTIENTNRFHVANTADDNNEGMVRILGIRGTVAVTNSTLQDGAEMLDFFVTGGTLNMTATNNAFNRAYKEFTSGALASQGGHCIDVTVQNASNANVTIGDRVNDALDNAFLNCRLGSVRVAADATATGNIDVILGRNDFTVNDHSSGFGGDFDFPQGGVAISAQPTTPDSVTFDVVVDGNYFDEITNASGGVGQLTLAMANGTWQVLVEDNTFDTPGNAPWFIRADSTSSARVRFQNNIGIKGAFCSTDPSAAGGGCNLGAGQLCPGAAGYCGPGLRALADLQNGAFFDLTMTNDLFGEHDAGFDPGQTFEARVLNTGGGGTLCLDLQNNQAPDGYSVEEFAGDFNLVGAGSCPVGSPSANCQTLLGNRGNRGGANVATTNPPFVNVEVGATIDVVAGPCQTPSGGIF